MSDEEKIKESTTEEISGGTFDPLNPNFVYCPKCRTAILKSHIAGMEQGKNGLPGVMIYICPQCKSRFGKPYGGNPIPGVRS